MREQPFYFEIKDIMTQFVGAFNNIIISRHDKDRDVRSKVHVRYVYAPKQRVVHDLTNKAKHLTLPVVAVNIGSVSRDESRVFNKIEGSYFASEETHLGSIRSEKSQTTYRMPQPVPINIEVNMSVLARYQTDVEQIISNFVPYNDPYIVISWKLPEGFSSKDEEIRSEVLWNGNLSMNYPDELSGTTPYRLACDTSFTIKTWLFKKHRSPVNNIFQITTNLSPVPEINSDFSFITPYYDELTESSYTSGLGPPLTAAPFITHIDTERYEENEILGYNMSSTTGVYLSSNEINSLSGVEVVPFTDSYLSSIYPSFSGVPINYNIVNDNKVYFDLPEVPENMTYDLIIQNIGGYDTALNSTLHGKGIFLS